MPTSSAAMAAVNRGKSPCFSFVGVVRRDSEGAADHSHAYGWAQIVGGVQVIEFSRGHGKYQTTYRLSSFSPEVIKFRVIILFS
jgi:hypothetical protein